MPCCMAEVIRQLPWLLPQKKPHTPSTSITELQLLSGIVSVLEKCPRLHVIAFEVNSMMALHTGRGHRVVLLEEVLPDG